QILQRDPALDALPGDVPARVQQTVDRCLRKPLKERMPDIGAVRLMLEGAFVTTARQTTAGGATAQRTWRRAVPVSLLLLGAASLGGVVVWQLMPARSSGSHTVVRFALPSSASIAPRGT